MLLTRYNLNLLWGFEVSLWEHGGKDVYHDNTEGRSTLCAAMLGLIFVHQHISHHFILSLTGLLLSPRSPNPAKVKPRAKTEATSDDGKFWYRTIPMIRAKRVPPLERFT